MQRRDFLVLPLFAVLPATASVVPKTIAVSFNAVAEIVRQIAPDATVVTLIPDKTEPHDFTPTLKTLRALKTAALFVTAGNGMEPWAEKAAAAAGIRHQWLRSAEGFGSAAEPHAWLAPAGARFMAKRIADTLSSADASNADIYRARFETFDRVLRILEVTYGEKYAAVPRKTIVTGHAAFGALCDQFGLEQKSVEDVFAHGEPTVKKLAELARWCKENGVHTVFSESMVSPAVSETLAREAGAKVIPIYTMESSEDGSPFLTRMEANLKRIADALAD